MRSANAALSAAGASSGCAGATGASAAATSSAHSAASAASNAGVNTRRNSVLVDIEHPPLQVELDATVVARRVERECPDRRVGDRDEAARVAAFEFDEDDARVGQAEFGARGREH